MRPSPQQYKWLLLPIENYVREFYGKLLLASVAAERGWASIIGYKGYVRNHLPGMQGAVIEINVPKQARVETYRQHGWKFSACDEEGLIYLNADEYCRRRVDEDAIRNLDRVFLWGEHQRADILDRRPGVEDKLVLTGNPRADLLRPELRRFYADKASRISSEQGKYILVNTNFGYVNHYFGRDYIFQTLVDQGRVVSEEQASDQRARERHQATLMQAFTEMLPALSHQFPQHKVIVRPHPSEDFDTWRKAVQGLPDVYMIHEGDAVPWLLGADAVIHNSCTTGVQAYLLNRPVISYMPVRSDKYDQYLPNALSTTARNLDELLALVLQAISDPHLLIVSNVQGRRNIAQQYVSSLDGPWASERIISQIDELSIEPAPIDPALGLALRSERGNTAGNARAIVRAGLHRVWNSLRPNQRPIPGGNKNWATYRRQRFPDLTFDEMCGDLERLKEATGRFADVRLYRTTEDLIFILPSAI